MPPIEPIPWWRLLPLVLIAALLIAKAVLIAGLDNACTRAGGHLQWTTDTLTGAQCVRHVQVIHP